MNALAEPISRTVDLASAPIGSPAPGGFLAGRILVAGVIHALIVSPKAQGDIEATPWNGSEKMVTGAQSYFDGLANTQAMADAGSALAKKVLALEIDGCADFYIPSRDELELIYRNLKPTEESNYAWRNGDNPSSVPAGYPYTEDSPEQTGVDGFKAGDPEALEDTWYWTSTQGASTESCAWIQTFNNGNQNYGHKSGSFRARAVRRLAI